MKVTIEGFLTHRTSYDGITSYEFFGFDPTNFSAHSDLVLVGPCSINVDVPDDFDPRPARIALLRKQKDKLVAELTMKTTRIDAQINELLALEHK